MTIGAHDSLLSLNCGSSSIKFALFTSRMQRTISGIVEAIGPSQTPRLKLPGTEAVAFGVQGQGHADLLPRLIDEIIVPRVGSIVGVGHRVVHGGEQFSAPVIIDGAVRDGIAGLTPLAPGHQPHNLAGIDATSSALPGAIQVACFDTAFHTGIAAVRREMALPRSFARRGLIRYGFHGLSYEHVAATLPHLGVHEGRVVACHLGNGCSISGMIDGVGRWTSMGFTPLDGLMMGQRPGRLDPGAVLWLLEHFEGDAAKVSNLLYQQSGLLGVSGISGDMRTLFDSHAPDAAFAIEMYVDRLVEEIGAATASLGGINALVFSGGIGENASEIRAQALAKLEWLGFTLDPKANAAGTERLTTRDSDRHAFIVKADEELVIAKAVANALAA